LLFYQLFIFQTGHRKYAVSSKRSNFDEVQFFKTNISAHNIWHT